MRLSLWLQILLRLASFCLEVCMEFLLTYFFILITWLSQSLFSYLRYLMRNTFGFNFVLYWLAAVVLIFSILPSFTLSIQCSEERTEGLSFLCAFSNKTKHCLPLDLFLKEWIMYPDKFGSLINVEIG